MSKAIEILNVEEGYNQNPYLDHLGYPTVAGGVRIGPKGASLSNYQFTVPREVGNVWTQSILNEKITAAKKYSNIQQALANCNEARKDIIYSMMYQLGVDGLAAFKNTLKSIAGGDFNAGAEGMLNSLWARQTPNRAQRHAEVMRSGTYDAYRGKI